MSKLKDIAISISSGLTPSRVNSSYWAEKEVNWLKTEQLGEFEIYDTTEYISKKALNETSLKLYPINTISIAMYGEGKTRGNVSILKKEMTTNQACCNIIIDKNKADYKYVYYFIKSHYKTLRGLSSGVRKNLNVDIIKNFPFNNIDLKNQRKMGSILYVLDKKIQLNNKINSELENMAKTVYDYWFLQFEFPNEEGKPYKSSGGKMVWNEELKKEIPDGWEVKYIKNYVSVVTGKEDANHSTINGKYPFFTCSNDVLSCNDYKFEGKAILIAGNGDFNIKYYDGKFNAYQRTYVLIPKEDIIGLLYQSTIRTVEKFKASSSGSIVKFITKGAVENILVLDSKNQVNISIFNELLDKIEKNNKENEELISLRDYLLPLLMNGQIGFKD